MTQENKKVIKIVRERTTAGCLTEGWKLLADNIWSLLRLSWPLIAVHALVGIAIAINQHPQTNNTAVFVVFIVIAAVLFLVWLWHTAMMIRRYNIAEYFPSISMLTLWKEDGAATAKSCMRQLRLVLTSPRQWPTMLTIIIVALLIKTLAALLFTMPLSLTTIVYKEAFLAVSMGDAIDLPSYLTWLYPCMAGISVAANCILQWIVFLPLALFIGKLLSRREATPSDY